MPGDIKADFDALMGTAAAMFAAEGAAKEVAVLAHGNGTIAQTDYDNYNGGVWTYTITLAVPLELFQQIGSVPVLEKSLHERFGELSRPYPQDYIGSVVVVPALSTDGKWKDKAIAWLAGDGVNNQGRVRSDNVASRQCDGLLFRSQPEIHLYQALKPLGVSFAPLPVFIRGGDTYRRIEPDFVIVKDGIVMVVEVDGDTVHRETPSEAHDRTAMLHHEGVHVERVSASECDSAAGAKAVAVRLLRVLAKLKGNR